MLGQPLGLDYSRMSSKDVEKLSLYFKALPVPRNMWVFQDSRVINKADVTSTTPTNDLWNPRKILMDYPNFDVGGGGIGYIISSRCRILLY